MLKRIWWLCVLLLYSLLFFTIPFAYSETVSCQKDKIGIFECVQLSMDGTLSEHDCTGMGKFVKSPCPTDDLISTCTYEMGVSSLVKSGTGFKPGPRKALKHQVNCYSRKGSTYEKRLEECKSRCKSLEGDFFSAIVVQKKSDHSNTNPLKTEAVGEKKPLPKLDRNVSELNGKWVFFQEGKKRTTLMFSTSNVVTVGEVVEYYDGNIGRFAVDEVGKTGSEIVIRCHFEHDKSQKTTMNLTFSDNGQKMQGTIDGSSYFKPLEIRAEKVK